MTKILIAAGALVVGAALGIVFCEATIRHLRRRVKELRQEKSNTPPEKKSILRSVTRFLFVTTQMFALGWVSISYGIAAYSTIELHQPFPVETLSSQAITTILGMSGLKVVENIFEHNEGVVFGQSKTEEAQPDSGGGQKGVG